MYQTAFPILFMDHHSLLVYKFKRKLTRTNLGEETLGEELLGPSAELDVEEGVVGVADLGVAESAQTELHHRPVVQDLGGGVGVGNGILEKEVTFNFQAKLREERERERRKCREQSNSACQ